MSRDPYFKKAYSLLTLFVLKHGFNFKDVNELSQIIDEFVKSELNYQEDLLNE